MFDKIIPYANSVFKADWKIVGFLCVEADCNIKDVDFTIEMSEYHREFLFGIYTHNFDMSENYLVNGHDVAKTIKQITKMKNFQ